MYKYIVFSLVLFSLQCRTSTILSINKEDSLIYLLKKTNDYQEKVDLLNQLTNLNFGSAPEKSLQFAREITNISADNSFIKGMAMGSLQMGRAYAMLGNYDEAFFVLTDAKKYYSQLGDTNNEASAINYMANVLFMGNYCQESLEYFQQCLDIKYAVNDSIGVAIAYSNIAECYLQMNMPDSALYYTLRTAFNKSNQ